MGNPRVLWADMALRLNHLARRIDAIAEALRTGHYDPVTRGELWRLCREHELIAEAMSLLPQQ